MCANQSSRTARPAPRILSQECMRLPNTNLIHKHAEVATKNWALRWTNGGHHRSQHRRKNAQNPSNARAWSGKTRAANRLADGD
jgi:hypothetical protein